LAGSTTKIPTVPPSKVEADREANDDTRTQDRRRQKGTPNKATANLRELAGAHGPVAVGVLVAIMTNGTTEASRLAAPREVLDRAYGRPSVCTEAGFAYDDLFDAIDFDVLDAPPIASPASTCRTEAKPDRRHGAQEPFSTVGELLAGITRCNETDDPPAALP